MTGPRQPLPSISPTLYRNIRAYETVPRQELEILGETIGEKYQDTPKIYKRRNPMSEEEQALALNILLFVDYYSLSVEKRPVAAVASARLSRMVAASVLTLLPESEVDNDDLVQEARLTCIRAARSFASEKGYSILTLLGASIINSHRDVGGVALKQGFGHRIGSPSNVSTKLSALRSAIFEESIEDGWAPNVEALYNHPNFFRKVPLEMIQPVEEEDAHCLPYDERGLEAAPELEAATLRSAEPGPETTTVHKFDNLIDILQSYGAGLTPRQILYLKLIYVDGLPQKDIGPLHPKPISRQAVSQHVTRAYKKIKSCVEEHDLEQLLWALDS